MQKHRVVLERLRRIVILTETLPCRLVIVVIHAAEPITRALDAEMVFGIHGQLTLSGSGLQQRLRHRDSRRDVVVYLLLDSSLLPLLNIGQIGLILVLRRQRHRHAHGGK